MGVLRLESTIERNDHPELLTCVGFIGVSIYTVIAVGGLYCTAQTTSIFEVGHNRSQEISDRSNLRFWLFLLTFCYSVFEIPRYALLLETRQYTSVEAYASHLVGSAIYFAMFSIVCYMWNGLVASHQRRLFTSKWLGIVNGVFSVYVVWMMYVCVSLGDLEELFLSTGFAVYTIVDTVKNVVYGVAIYWYGSELLSMIGGFAMAAEDRVTVVAHLRRAVRRLMLAMMVCLGCFLLRAAMLFLKVMSLNGIVEFPLFGITWWILDDFVPRGVPAIAFLLLLGKKPPSKRPSLDESLGSSNALASYAGDLEDPLLITDKGDRAAGAGEFLKAGLS